MYRNRILLDKHPMRAVVQYTKKGEFVAEYSSMNEAERATGIKSGSISSCCLGKTKTAGGFIFLLKEEEHDLAEEVRKRKSRKHEGRHVIQYTWNKRYINEFRSVAKAAEKCHVGLKTIYDCCNGLRELGGMYRFRFKEDVDREKMERNKKKD